MTPEQAEGELLREMTAWFDIPERDLSNLALRTSLAKHLGKVVLSPLLDELNRLRMDNDNLSASHAYSLDAERGMKEELAAADRLAEAVRWSFSATTPKPYSMSLRRRGRWPIGRYQ